MLMIMVGKDVRDQTTRNIEYKPACQTNIDKAIASTFTGITRNFQIMKKWEEGEWVWMKWVFHYFG